MSYAMYRYARGPLMTMCCNVFEKTFKRAAFHAVTDLFHMLLAI